MTFKWSNYGQIWSKYGQNGPHRSTSPNFSYDCIYMAQNGSKYGPSGHNLPIVKICPKLGKLKQICIYTAVNCKKFQKSIFPVQNAPF